MYQILKELISIESISGQEHRICDHVEAILLKGGGQVERHGNSVVWSGEYRVGRPTIALGAHLDTVPFERRDWEITEPTTPREINGRIYGRGACDMKAGAAIILDLIRQHRYGKDFNLKAFFYDKEELGMPNGVSDLIRKGFFTDTALCIIPEPTECRLTHGVFGNLNAVLRAKGIAAHSAMPEKGRNALYELWPVVDQIRRMPLRKNQGISEAISVNRIQGGSAINVLPDRAEAWLDYRFDPDIPQEQIRQKVMSLRRENVDVEITGIYPGVIHEVNKYPLLEKLSRLTGTSTVVPFWSDIGQLAEAGVVAVNFGPGSIDQAHRKDEYVPVSDMETVRKVLIELLTRRN